MRKLTQLTAFLCSIGQAAIRKIIVVLLCLFCLQFGYAQRNTDTDIHYTRLLLQGIPLNNEWRFVAGNNLTYSNPNYDDCRWSSINPTLNSRDLSHIPKGIGWFRLHLQIDSPELQQALALKAQQSEASEIYLNGRLIQRFGQFFTTEPTGEGTGLGLSLSYDIINAHGGELKVETKEGEYSIFDVLLPL